MMDNKKGIKIIAVVAVVSFIGLIFAIMENSDVCAEEGERLQTIKNMEMKNADDVYLMINYTNDFDFEYDSGYALEAENFKTDAFRYITGDGNVSLEFLNLKKNDIYLDIEDESALLGGILWSVVYVLFMGMVSIVIYMNFHGARRGEEDD